MASLTVLHPGNFFAWLWSKTAEALAFALEENETSAKKEVDAEASDAEWVRSFQGGQEQGFNRLVRRHQDRVYTLCYRVLGDVGEAEEAAQETFMRVHRGLKSFRAEAQFSTWLYRIAVNASLNLRKAVGRTLFRNAVEFSRVEESLEDSAGGPEADLERKRKEEWIQSGIRALPKEFRAPVVLHDIEGRDYAEIAEITKVNVGTVRSRLHRGRERLRAFFAERKT